MYSKLQASVVQVERTTLMQRKLIVNSDGNKMK